MGGVKEEKNKVKESVGVFLLYPPRRMAARESPSSTTPDLPETEVPNNSLVLSPAQHPLRPSDSAHGGAPHVSLCLGGPSHTLSQELLSDQLYKMQMNEAIRAESAEELQSLAEALFRELDLSERGTIPRRHVMALLRPADAEAARSVVESLNEEVSLPEFIECATSVAAIIKRVPPKQHRNVGAPTQKKEDGFAL